MCWDSNPQPLECEPPSISTRPGTYFKLTFVFTNLLETKLVTLYTLELFLISLSGHHFVHCFVLGKAT